MLYLLICCCVFGLNGKSIYLVIGFLSFEEPMTTMSVELLTLRTGVIYDSLINSSLKNKIFDEL